MTYTVWSTTSSYTDVKSEDFVPTFGWYHAIAFLILFVYVVGLPIIMLALCVCAGFCWRIQILQYRLAKLELKASENKGEKTG